MPENVQREIKGLHTFFERWFLGSLPNNTETFERCTEALGPGFELVTPGGRVLTRAEITAQVREAHGSRAATPGGFRIWIEGFACRPLGGGRSLARYEEWHELEGARRGRLSTAVFRSEPGAPNGILWEHVHETWLPTA